MPKPTRYTARDGTTTWRVRFRYRGRQTSETFNTKRDADRFCRTLDDYGAEHAVRTREELEPSDAPTLDSLFPAFIAWKAGRVRSARTTNDYTRDWHKHISPAFGHQPADTITPGMIQRWVDDMQTNGAAPKSIHDRHALLAAVYRWAVQREHVPSTPCADTDLPPKRKGDAKGLEPDQWAHLHAELEHRCPQAADLAAILVGSGMRWSEATALTPAQVIEGADALHVRVSHVMRRAANGSLERVEDTKSVAGRRTISMLGPAAPTLARILEDHTGSDDDLLLAPPGGGLWFSSNFRRWWNPAVEAAAISPRPTPHALRHTHAYWLIRANVPLVEVQRRLGHANISTTVDTYGRMVNDVAAAGAARFNELAASGLSTRELGV